MNFYNILLRAYFSFRVTLYKNVFTAAFFGYVFKYHTLNISGHDESKFGTDVGLFAHQNSLILFSLKDSIAHPMDIHINK